MQVLPVGLSFSILLSDRLIGLQLQPSFSGPPSHNRTTHSDGVTHTDLHHTHSLVCLVACTEPVCVCAHHSWSAYCCSVLPVLMVLLILLYCTSWIEPWIWGSFGNSSWNVQCHIWWCHLSYSRLCLQCSDNDNISPITSSIDSVLSMILWQW